MMVFAGSPRQLQMVKGAAPGDAGAGDAVVLGMAEGGACAKDAGSAGDGATPSQARQSPRAGPNCVAPVLSHPFWQRCWPMGATNSK